DNLFTNQEIKDAMWDCGSEKALGPDRFRVPCSKTYFKANNLPECVVFEFQRLVPSCYVIFDLEPLSLSFDFVFDSEIFKSFPCLSLSSLPSCDLVPNRYPVDTSLIHIESYKSPTAELFDVDSGRISIHHCKLNASAMEVECLMSQVDTSIPADVVRSKASDLSTIDGDASEFAGSLNIQVGASKLVVRIEWVVTGNNRCDLIGLLHDMFNCGIANGLAVCADGRRVVDIGQEQRIEGLHVFKEVSTDNATYSASADDMVQSILHAS
ncbi:hypothetical protein Tco_0648505, partial [Tanacetum coccineum]